VNESLKFLTIDELMNILIKHCGQFKAVKLKTIPVYFLKVFLKEKSVYCQKEFLKTPLKSFLKLKEEFYFYLIQKIARRNQMHNLQLKYLTFYWDYLSISSRSQTLFAKYNVMVHNQTLDTFKKKLLEKKDFDFANSVLWFDNYVKIHFKKYSSKLQNITLSNK
jgi:hypothetical protein